MKTVRQSHRLNLKKTKTYHFKERKMLDKKERILALLKEGKTPKEVAKTLNIRPQDVYNTAYLDRKRKAKLKIQRAVVRATAKLRKKKITLKKKLFCLK